MIENKPVVTLITIVVSIAAMLFFSRLPKAFRRRLISIVAFGAALFTMYSALFVNRDILVMPAGLIVTTAIAAWFVYFGVYNSRHFHLWLTWRVQWVFRGMILFTVLMFFLYMVTSGFGVAYLAIMGAFGGLLACVFLYLRWVNCRANKSPEFAIEYITQQIKLNPHNVNSYFQRGYAYEQLGQFEMASADYETVAEMVADQKAKNAKFGTGDLEQTRFALHTNRGRLYTTMGDADAALSEFDDGFAVRDLMPWQEFLLFSNRAVAYIDKGDIESALHDIAESEIRLKNFRPKDQQSGSGTLAIQRSLAYYRQGDMEQALIHWRQAIASIPENGDSEKLSKTHIGPQWRLDAMLDMNERLKALS